MVEQGQTTLAINLTNPGIMLHILPIYTLLCSIYHQIGTGACLFEPRSDGTRL